MINMGQHYFNIVETGASYTGSYNFNKVRTVYLGGNLKKCMKNILTIIEEGRIKGEGVDKVQIMSRGVIGQRELPRDDLELLVTHLKDNELGVTVELYHQ